MKIIYITGTSMCYRQISSRTKLIWERRYYTPRIIISCQLYYMARGVFIIILNWKYFVQEPNLSRDAFIQSYYFTQTNNSVHCHIISSLRIASGDEISFRFTEYSVMYDWFTTITDFTLSFKRRINYFHEFDV